MKMPVKMLLAFAALLIFSSLAHALPTTYTIDFEEFPEFTQITNQYSADYVTFQNALQLVAPDYDYFDFPPTSGNGVITNDPNDPIQLNFSGAVEGVTGFYADPNGITVTAYNSTGGILDIFDGAAVIGSDLEFEVTSNSQIAYITISDDTGSPDSETVDDISFTVTPEPDSFLLLGSGLLGLAGMLRRKFARE
ncbi:MAG: PEP-CTERM sorting domain-containing protein [Terracidiphilus sp.]|jgi:hypothetical protein